MDVCCILEAGSDKYNQTQGLSTVYGMYHIQLEMCLTYSCIIGLSQRNSIVDHTCTSKLLPLTYMIFHTFLLPYPEENMIFLSLPCLKAFEEIKNFMVKTEGDELIPLKNHQKLLRNLRVRSLRTVSHKDLK